MTIDTEKAVIYGSNGSAMYYINDCGGVELTGETDGGLSDAEYAEAETELSK